MLPRNPNKRQISKILATSTNLGQTASVVLEEVPLKIFLFIFLTFNCCHSNQTKWLLIIKTFFGL